MKKRINKMLRKLLSSGLIIAMVLFNSIAVFASDEIPEEQRHEDSAVTEMKAQETPQGQPASSSETSEPKPAEQAHEPSAVETTDASPVTAEDISAETVSTDQNISTEVAAATAEDVSADTEVPDVELSDPSEPDMSESGTVPPPAEEESTKATESSSGKTIHIGDDSFDPGDDESSHWKDGKGWKNIGGQYIAMVDYDGSDAEVSADEGLVTLAVAGVNRIGALKGNCSYNIVGSGIVLIDSIEIEDGNGISLMPNTEIYDEGSAAVFLKQDNNTYKLINGSITGILDESYVLDNVNLVIPEGSDLKLGAMCVRTETWVPDGSDEPVTDVTLYTTDMPNGSAFPSHPNATVSIKDYGSRLVIGKNSTLTIDSGAAVHLNGLRTQNNYLDVKNPKVVGELIVQGALNVAGAIEGGGYIDVHDGGTLSGTGTVKSAEVDLETGGNLNVPLEDGILTIYSNADGSNRVVSPTVKDSIIYLRGSNITLPDLNVSGSSTLSIDTRDSKYDPYNRIGNITLTQGSNLDIAVNKYDTIWAPTGYVEQDLLDERDGLTDSFLEIYGVIIGGTVSVLAGCVKYTGTDSDVFPLVPVGYASRALVSGNSDISTEDPLNMTQAESGSRAKLDRIPVVGYVVFDDWLTDKGMFHVWRVEDRFVSDPLSRSSEQEVTVPDLLRKFYLLDESGHVMSRFQVAVELIYSDFSRSLIKCIDYYPTSEDIEWAPISLDDVVMVRVLQYMATGGFGGSSTTHTMASTTGTGVIGRPGSGSIKTGNGAVIYGVKYVKPEPIDPKPVDPEPVDPKPVDPEPTDPKPVDPEPTDPKPVDPEPADPTPVDPTPVDPTPADPTPVDPTPVIPEDQIIDNIADSNSMIAKAISKTIVSEVNDAGLTVSVSLRVLTAEEAEKYPGIPQIWQLSITDGGIPVTDMSGSPVKVTFPFTLPEEWGDPAEIDADSLYAVFADDNELSAYKAEYDPETGEISFETEETGDFVIVQFKYDDEPFTEDFYKALAELKEIKDFLAMLSEEYA